MEREIQAKMRLAKEIRTMTEKIANLENKIEEKPKVSQAES